MSTWTWRYEGPDGGVLGSPELPRAAFPSQADAETWVGEAWHELLASGVEQVTLLHEGEIVYAAMSLRPVE